MAETSARTCEICFKPSTSVLITPDNKDFFYVCPGHLQDRQFCTPIIDQAAVEAKKKAALEEEVARVKKEYEEKQRKKKEKEAAEKKSDKEKDKHTDKDSKANDEKTEAEKTEAEKSGKPTESKSPEPEEEPREFELKRMFYQERINKKRNAEIAKRNRERMRDPNFFPSVPKGPP